VTFERRPRLADRLGALRDKYFVGATRNSHSSAPR
jgi:hypothetical protein